jgi:hypothetical protein
MSAREIFALRRQGRQAEALDLARRAHAGAGEGAPDIWLLRAYAWVLYDRIRQAVDAHEAGRLSPTALHAEISPALREFSRMADPLRRDSAFSPGTTTSPSSTRPAASSMICAPASSGRSVVPRSRRPAPKARRRHPWPGGGRCWTGRSKAHPTING